MIFADHNILFIPFFAADEARTLDAVLRNDQSAVEGMSDATIRINDNDTLYLQLLLQNSRRPGKVPWLTSTLNASFSHSLLIVHGTSGLSAGIKWRPEPSELPGFGPEFKELWDAYLANAPDKPVLWMGVMSSYVFMLALPVNLYYFALQYLG